VDSYPNREETLHVQKGVVNETLPEEKDGKEKEPALAHGNSEYLTKEGLEKGESIPSMEGVYKPMWKGVGFNLIGGRTTL
jgi:hypothetical protein